MSSTTSGGTFYMKAIFSIWLSSFNARETVFHLQAVLVQGNSRWCWLHTCWSGGLLSYLKSSFEALASGTEPSAPNYTNLHAKIVVPVSLQLTIIERLKTIFHAGERLHAWDVVQLCQNRWCIQHWVFSTGHWAKYDQIQDSTQTQKQKGILCWWWPKYQRWSTIYLVTEFTIPNIAWELPAFEKNCWSWITNVFI